MHVDVLAVDTQTYSVYLLRRMKEKKRENDGSKFNSSTSLYPALLSYTRRYRSVLRARAKRGRKKEKKQPLLYYICFFLLDITNKH